MSNDIYSFYRFAHSSSIEIFSTLYTYVSALNDISGSLHDNRRGKSFLQAQEANITDIRDCDLRPACLPSDIPPGTLRVKFVIFEW
ncbi:hypothetical protein ACI0X9_003270 [Cronobacter turicensis]